MRIAVERISKEDAFASWASNVSQKLESISTDDEELQKKITALKVNLQSVIKEQKNHDQNRQAYQKQLTTLQMQITDANGREIEALLSRMKALETQIAGFKAPTVSVEFITQLSALQQDYRMQKVGLDQAAKLNSSLRAQLSGVIADNERQMQQCTAWQEEFKKQSSERAKVQAEALTELQSLFVQNKTALNKRIAELEKRIGVLEVKHDTLASKTDPEFTVAQKLLKLRQVVLEDKFISEELKYYVAPNGEAQPGLGDHEALYEWVQTNFLDLKAESQVLLLQGQAGAGKSTFNRFLLKHLWQDKAWETFKPGEKVPFSYVPIFIPLGSQQVTPSALLKYLADLPELVEDFTEAEVNVLKCDYRLLLIADGYDEMPGRQALNLYDVNQLDQYEGRFKLLIGCRTQRAQELDETTLFVPHDSVTGKPQYNAFKRRHISPFNETQIRDYLAKYLAQNKDRTDILIWKEVKDYETGFARLPDLKALITTPFLLLMGIEILPAIMAETMAIESKESKTPNTAQLTRSKVYDYFMDGWFKRQVEKARKSGDTTPPKLLMQQYRQFCLKFAERLRAAGITSVQYPYGEEELFDDDDLLSDKPKAKDDPQGPRGPWVKKLFGTENEAMFRARKGAPLLIATGNYYQFIHASLIDYFLTTAISEQARVEIAQATTEVTVKKLGTSEVKTEVVILPDTESNSTEVLLNQGPLTKDQIGLLVDQMQENSQLKEILFQFIERSKKEASLSQVAANAITVLNAARISFSGMDFNGIRIPGADLSNAVLDSTQLQGADLRRVTFTGAWLSQANLAKSNMENIEWGEYPYLKFPFKEMYNTVYSRDGHWLASWDRDADGVCLFNLLTDRLQRIFQYYSYQGYKEGVGKYYLVLTDCVPSNIGEFKQGELSGYRYKIGWLPVEWSKKSAAYIRVKNQLFFLITDFDSNGECRLLEIPEEALTKFDAEMQTHSLTLNTHRELSDEELWDIQSITGHSPWDEIREHLELSYYSLNEVAFDSQSKYLVAPTRRGKIAFLDLATGKSLFHLSVKDMPALSVSGKEILVFTYLASQSKIAFDLRGEFGACPAKMKDRGRATYVHLWQISTRKIMRILEVDASEVNNLAFEPQGKYLALAGKDIGVQLWEVGTGKLVEKFAFGFNSTYTTFVEFDPQGKYLASCIDSGGQGCLWLVETKKLYWTFKTSCNIAFDDRGEHLAIGDNFTVQVWHIATKNLKYSFEGHIGKVTKILFDPQGDYLLSESEDKTIRKWRLTTSSSRSSLENHSGSILCMVASSDGEYLASSAKDRAVCLWNVATGKLGCKLGGHEDNVVEIAFDPSSKMLLAAAGKSIYLWNVTTRELEYTFVCDKIIEATEYGTKIEIRPTRIAKISFYPSGEHCMSVFSCESRKKDSTEFKDCGYKLLLWNLKTRKLDDLPRNIGYGGIDLLAFDSAGKHFAFWASDKLETMFIDEKLKDDSQTYKTTTRGTFFHGNHYRGSPSFAFDPKGEWLAVGGGSYSGRVDDDGSDEHPPPISLWNDSSKIRHLLVGHTKKVSSVTFDPTGERLASASKDMTVRLWQVATGTSLAVIEKFTGPVKQVAWLSNSQGSFITTASDDKGLSLWRVVEEKKDDKNNIRTILCWTTHQAVLAAFNTCLDGAQGLKESDLQLLQQRGAKVAPISVKSGKDSIEPSVESKNGDRKDADDINGLAASESMYFTSQ